MSLFVRDYEHVVCPFCGYQHGDAFAWAMNENPDRIACERCGEEFLYWAETTVEFVSKRPDPETVAKLRAILEGTQQP